MKIYKGYSLLGIMVAISLSSLLLWVIVDFYIQHQRQHIVLFRQLALQQNIERLLQTMKKDIRRSGFMGKSNKVEENNMAFFLNQVQHQPFVIAEKNGELKKSCFIFTYDLDESGCIGGLPKSHKSCIYHNRNNTKFIQKELFGYRLNKGVVETRVLREKQIKENCSQVECQKYVSPWACNHKGWHKFLDDYAVDISQLKFKWVKRNQLLEVELKGRLKQYKNITYETKAIIPLFNRGK